MVLGVVMTMVTARTMDNEDGDCDEKTIMMTMLMTLAHGGEDHRDRHSVLAYVSHEHGS